MRVGFAEVAGDDADPLRRRMAAGAGGTDVVGRLRFVHFLDEVTDEAAAFGGDDPDGRVVPHA